MVRKTGSPSRSVKIADAGSSGSTPETSFTSAGNFRVPSTSTTSRPRSDSAPTTVMAGSLSANLTLRLRAGGILAETPPYDAARADHDASSYVRDGESEEYRLRKNPDQINQCRDENDRQRRARLHKMNILEAGITPGTDHQK